MKDKELKLQVLKHLEDLMNQDIGSKVKSGKAPVVVKEETVVVAKPKDSKEEFLKKLAPVDDEGEGESEEGMCEECGMEDCPGCSDMKKGGSVKDKLKMLLDKKMSKY